MEIARHLVEKGLVKPEDEERAAEEIAKKLEELQAKAESAKVPGPPEPPPSQIPHPVG